MTTVFVQFGKQAFVAPFTAVGPVRRNDAVVVRTVRGREIGTALCEAKTADSPLGAIERTATDDDRATQARADALADHVLADATNANEYPVVFADAESTLDGLVLLHVLPLDACDLSARLRELGDTFGVRVSLIDLSTKQTLPDAPDAHDGHCGKPNCGEGNCSTTGGCSSGSCSRGAVKDAGELTDYFQSLRSQMEADRRVSLR
jgi:cell fate regulator YaaT (PSP1 superfamily)